jgi:hypothetical protein
MHLIKGRIVGVYKLSEISRRREVSSVNSVLQPAHGGTVSHVMAEATYGIAKGHPFIHVIKGRIVGKYRLSEIKAAVADFVCTEYISDVSKANGDNPFNSETQQICTGYFGGQSTATQMLRSSWSGPRGYDAWRFTPQETDNFSSQNWTVACNYGTGDYNYYPIMYGDTYFGPRPTIRSNNEIDNAHCGTAPG